MSGFCKYYKQKRQVSYNNGLTWQDVPGEYQRGSLYEPLSSDCGFMILERWVILGTTCVGVEKHYVLGKQISTDLGETWSLTEETKIGDTIEAESMDCIKMKAVYLDGVELLLPCNGSYELSMADTTSFEKSISAMTSAVIGNCVTSIGKYAFDVNHLIHCSDSNLTAVTLSSGVTRVEDNAFYMNDKLAIVNGWNQLRYIGKNAFNGCNNLENSDIPSGLTSINEQAFWANFKLRAATIPSGIISIADGAFANCRGITSVTIPDSVRYIGAYAFAGCEQLPSVQIPSGVTKIQPQTFLSCISLESFEIPSGVTEIGTLAFNGCYNLDYIICHPETPPTLGYRVFENTNYCPIYVPCESVQLYRSEWSEYAERIQKISGSCDFKAHIVYNGGAVEEIECNESTVLTSGETSSGHYRYNITSAVIGDCVTSIGDAAFSMMDNATASTFSSITFTSNDVTTIGNDAFIYCHKLTEFCEYSTNYCGHAEANFTSVGSRAFMGCSGLTWMNVTGLTSLPSGVFGYCTSLSTVSLNSGLTSIGDSAFIGCTSLCDISNDGAVTTFRIPDAVTTIGDSAFSGCSSSRFYSVNIPSGVTSIGQHAFDGCSGMNAVYVYPTTPPTLGKEAFHNMKSNCPIFVPCDSIDTYKAASGWSTYSSRIFGLAPCYAEKYVQIGDTTCVGKDEYYRTIKYTSNDGGYSWNISDPIEYGIGTLKLANSYKCGGTEGIAYKATYTSGRTYSASCDSISAVTTSTTKYSGYEYSAMTSAEIGSCVQRIGHRAFTNCTGLTSITVNATTPPYLEADPYGGGSGGQFDYTNNCPIYVPCESVVSYKSASGWSTYASRIQGIPPCEESFKFKSNISSGGCSTATTLYMYEVASFTGNNGVTYVTIGNCTTTIQTNALQGYYNLKTLTIPASVTSIGNGAFSGCTALTSITINSSTPPSLPYTNALASTNNCPIYVPSEAVNTFKTASGWSTYASRIQAIQT